MPTRFATGANVITGRWDGESLISLRGEMAERLKAAVLNRDLIRDRLDFDEHLAADRVEFDNRGSRPA
jgi:hypothetical protein